MTSFNSTISSLLRLTCVVSVTASVIACGSRRDKSPEEINENAPFRVESFALKDVQASKLDSVGLPSVKTYTFIACVQDSVMRAPIVYTPFDIADGESAKTIRTDNNGCLLWDEVHPVDALQNESLYKISRTIIGRDAVQGSVKLDLAFNPSAADPSAIQDLRKFTPVYPMTELKNFSFNTEATAVFAQDTTRKAMLNVASLSLSQPESNFSQYRVNKLLSMQWARDYQLSITPTAIRKKMDGSDDPVTLSKGKFRVQFIMVKEDSQAPFKASDVITGFDQVVEVSPYPIAQTVTIPLQDPSLVSSRTKALIKISIVGDLQNRVRTSFFIAKVAPLKGGDAEVKFRISKEDTAQIFNLQDAGNLFAPPENNETGLSLFMKNSGFKPMLMNKIPRNEMFFVGSGLYDLEANTEKYFAGSLSVEDEHDFMVALCYKTYQNSFAGASGKILKGLCGMSPHQAIKVTVREFVVNVINPVPQLVGIPQDYTLSVANTISYSDSTSVSRGWDLSGKFSIDGPSVSFPVLGGLSSGFSYGISKSVNTTNSSSTSASVSKGQSLTATAETYDIAVETKKCLLFSATQSRHDKMSSDPKMNGFITCKNGTEKKTIRETYYIIDQSVSSTTTRDGDAANASRWRMKIRGTENFNIFHSIVADPKVVLEFQQFSENPELKRLTPEYMIFQSYPGMLSSY